MTAVQTGYRHLTKAIVPAPGIELGGSSFKWYDIAPADEPVPRADPGAGAREPARRLSTRERSLSTTTSAS